MRVLIGGGWDRAALAKLYGPFLDAAGQNPTVACVVIDEGDGIDQFRRWSVVLEHTAPCRPTPILVPLGGRLNIDLLHDADGLLVCGGSTPAYARALVPVAGAIQHWLARGRPYAGFSAGAAIAADRAIIGGFQSGGRTVCPEDAGEDLTEIAVVEGLGLVGPGVDVHAAQWGTLGRLVAAVDSGRLVSGMAIDENTALLVNGDVIEVIGVGAAHLVTRAGDGVAVRTVAAGRRLLPD